MISKTIGFRGTNLFSDKLTTVCRLIFHAQTRDSQYLRMDAKVSLRTTHTTWRMVEAGVRWIPPAKAGNNGGIGWNMVE